MKTNFVFLCVLLLSFFFLLGCDEEIKKDSVNAAEELRVGYEYYDNDNYEEALRHLLKAYETGLEDGILVYRIAYSYEQLQGIDDNVKKVYRYALKLLSQQYPDNRYYRYARNKVQKFNKSKSKSLFPMAENGDFYNFDNDGDGRREPVHVNGYFRSDGTYVRGHYRARPR